MVTKRDWGRLSVADVNPMSRARNWVALWVLLAVICTGCLPVARMPLAHSPVTSARPDSPAPKVVRFVYFIETDVEYDQQHRDALAAQALELQRYWYQQFGTTFSLNSPVVEVVFGDHPTTWYEETPSHHAETRFWRGQNIWDEVRVELGIPSGGENFVGIVYPHSGPHSQIGVFDHLVGYGTGAAVMDIDDIWCAAGEARTEPYPGTPANCLTLVAHELGHAFGLEHTGDQNNCMQFGFYDQLQRCNFAPEHVRQVLSSPHASFLQYEPGDILGGQFVF